MSDAPRLKDGQTLWLLAATFTVAVAGLVYELIAGAVSSYLLGDSVTQFSMVIGVFMTSMGLGAWASRYVTRAERGFTLSQIMLGIVGGFSAPALFLAYGYLDGLQLILFAIVIAIGALSGLEIPLITRILTERGAMTHTLSSVLTADYAGALVAAVAFPLLVVPQLGLMAASLVFGLLNLLVAGVSVWVFRDQIGWGLRAAWGFGLVACVAGLIWADRLVSLADAAFFDDDVVFSEETPYQRIVVTRWKDRYRLFLNGSIQFDTLDEHRYHEALIHPAMARLSRHKDVLILGGGDGMAVREVLRWPDVEQVTLVDLDPRVVELFRDNGELAALNGGALSDPRVKVHAEDAWTFVRDDQGSYDLIVLDLPDPQDFAVSKLYSREFYAPLVERVATNGAIVSQAGSPLFARNAFWSVVRTMAETRNPYAVEGALNVTPYHAYVPSFGDWGFVLASPKVLPNPDTLPPGLKFFTPEIWPVMTTFAKDMRPTDAEANTILSHPLVRYYETGWAEWMN
ncbi:polyamine aminopropyltransferase [Rhodobacteraceae bacterium]|nr:polyamine aminopropyltransferase [Paracoccaceae bacterium]